MKKMLKRLCTGFLALATVVTTLPTTPVHAESKQYWTESKERVGIVEKVMNDGSIGSTFNEGHLTVEGEDAYCIDINTDFRNGYKTRIDASTRMSAVETDAALVRANGIVELNAVADVVLHFALVVNPGDAEGEDAVRLNHALYDASFLELRVLVVDFFYTEKNFFDGLKELLLAGMLGLQVGHDLIDVHVF